MSSIPVDVGQIADQIRKVRAQQGFAAREAQLPHAQAREQTRQPCDFGEGQSFLRFQEPIMLVILLLGHAVRAAEIATIHHRDPQVVQRPAQTIERALRSGDAVDVRCHGR